MKHKHKFFLKANFMSIFFIAVSFISGTLAWFAYTGLSDVATQIDIRAWNIELNKDGKDASNNVVIALSEISPGMETQSEVININNKGDTDALVNYKIASARILDGTNDNFIAGDKLSSEAIEDKISNDYPFHININLTKGYVMSKGDQAQLQVSVSWPYDSGDDKNDSLWGSNAYNFQKNEANKSKSPIEIVLKLSAEQYMETGKGSDPDYNMGDIVSYDIKNDQICYDTTNPNCIKTFVLDKDNQQSSKTVNLLPYFTNDVEEGTFAEYSTKFKSIDDEWKVNIRPLEAKDILYDISSDINNSVFVRASLSDRIIGYMDYADRVDTELLSVSSKDVNGNEVNGFYQYKIKKDNDSDKSKIFSYLSANSCIWTDTNYNDTKAFGIENDLNEKGRLYGIDKTVKCKILPVIIGNKKAK